MDTLGAGDDFLAAHEGVVGVCKGGGGGGEVGVKGARGNGVVGEDVEVGVEFVEDEFSEGFFVGGAVMRKRLTGVIVGSEKKKEEKKGYCDWKGGKGSLPYVFVFGCLNAGFLEHFDAICESYPRGAAFGDLEVACIRIFALDNAHVVFVALTEAVEYKN